MTDIQIRAWKDQDFRATLDADAQAALTPHPAGRPADAPESLDHIAGGESTEWLLSLGCCQGFSQGCQGLTEHAPYCTVSCITIWWTTRAACKPTGES